jgi:hypothetical protein
VTWSIIIEINIQRYQRKIVEKYKDELITVLIATRTQKKEKKWEKICLEKKDMKRQNEIIHYLGYKFIRIKIDNKNNIIEEKIYENAQTLKA